MKDFDSVRAGVLEVVDGQQPGVAVADPGNLKKGDPCYVGLN